MLKKIVSNVFPFAFREAARWPDLGIMKACWVALPGDEFQPRSTAYRCRFSSAGGVFRIGVSADTVYRLYLDGKLAALGPEQGDEKHTFLEQFECKLEPGEHTFVALVSSFAGRGPFSRMEFRHGFFFAAEGEAGEYLDSNSENWRALPVPGHTWRPIWGPAFSVGLSLAFDAAAYPTGIEAGDGDNWEGVTELYPGRDARQANEFRPQPLFYPATLPAMLDTLVGDYQLRYFGPDNGSRLSPADNRTGELADAEHALKWGTFRVSAETKVKLLLELDGYYCVLPELVVSGGRGAKISLGWAEALYIDEAHEQKGNRREWQDRYFYGVCDHFLPDGRDRMHFYTAAYRAGRFISLTIETAGEELLLDDLQLNESRYPVSFDDSFESNDRGLNELARLSRRTLEMCSHDSFMDCPYFEQLMYLGDTRIQALLTLQVSRDARLVEKALRMFAASQLPSGFFQSRYPSRVTQVIPTFSPFFVGMLEDYARYRGGPLVKELLPAARRVADAFDSCVGEDGLVSIPRSWCFVDWTHWYWGVPPEGEYGVSGIVNALYVYGLASLANLYELTGDSGLERYYRDRAAALTERMAEAFYCEKRGLFADTRAKESFSEHAQILMLLAGTLPPEQEERCAEALFTADGLTQCTVYFAFYLFEVFHRFGRADLLERRLEPFREMIGLGLATLLERPEPSRSDCHAWSAHVLYHFHASMLGVRSKGYAFREVAVAPQVVPGRKVGGSVPHPGGGVIEVEADSISAFVSLPDGVSGEFIYPDGRKASLSPGKQHFSYR